MLKLLITAGCLCAATVAHAEPVTLSGQQVRDLVAGATIEIDTPLGTKLPIRYATDGQLSGQARELAWYLGAATDKGRWWTAGDRLCHKWDRWFDGEPQCMRLKKDGRTIEWLNHDGNSGTAVISVPAPIQAASVPAPVHVEARPRSAAPDAPRVADASQARLATMIPLGAEQQFRVPDSEPSAEAPSASHAAVTTGPPAAQPASVPQQAPDPRRAAGPMYMVANVERDDVLNVRSGPSTDFDVVGELQPGSRGVAITGACRSQWCPVQHQAMAGWVNRAYLADEDAPSARRARMSSIDDLLADDAGRSTELRDPPEAPRGCLTPAARTLLDRIEEKFGPVRLVSTCRPGATIGGTGRPSRHASGNAIDFDAGSRKAEIVEWLIANHHDGGTMTYADMDHVHIDIGPHFVSIAGGRHWASWRNEGDFPGRQ